MALKGGRIFQEMIEVPDEQESGCGLLVWIAIILVGLFLVKYLFSFLSEHKFITIVIAIVLIAIFRLRNK
ncbi:preprotein translocase, SecE subunit domain protein [Enterococcus faecium]|uniref:preprotein translocase, SecE subunit domain protein n=1 Tax=Enterococcus faecium TaxID=1352 RepID=UPI001883ED31|nr:preprotein translocase, SecE subunit domain protein [Enterococcus faecium]MBE9882413.1 preprotein translocase, SecE subunit domain protein [Enterococcus faecium]